MNIAQGKVSDHEAIAVWTGGSEIHPLVNRRLSLGWTMTRDVDYRDASLYFWTWQILYDYIQSSEDFSEGLSDNDPRAYVRLLNLPSDRPVEENRSCAVQPDCAS